VCRSAAARVGARLNIHVAPGVVSYGEHDGFGARARERRRQLSMSLRERARRAGLAETRLTYVVRGLVTPNDNDMSALRRTLGLDDL
jgi:hypothetical protein